MSHAPLPPFLLALGLGSDADERAVRRAYAQRLKRIDQANDVHGFQALREAYETALHWTRRQAPRDEAGGVDEPPACIEAASGTSDQTDGTPAAPPVATPQAVSEAVRLGNEVFGTFAAREARPFHSEADAHGALEAALADERLINLEARGFFEWRVANLLLDGWKPGHEFLFGPACTCFHWEQDRRQLARFGPLGAALDAAIEEKLFFFRQAPQAFDAQRNVIRRLRDEAQPTEAELVDLVPLLRLLVQRHPNWLRVVTPPDNLARWHQAWEALPPVRREAALRQATPPPSTASASTQTSFSWWWVLMLVVGLVKLVSSIGGTPSPSPPRLWDAPPAARATTAPPLSPWGRSPTDLQGGPAFNGPGGLGQSPPSAPFFNLSAASPPTRAPDEKQKALERRQHQSEYELRKAVEDARRAVRNAPAPKADTSPEPSHDAAAPTGWAMPMNTPLPYDLLRQPDGSTLVPRLGQ